MCNRKDGYEKEKKEKTQQCMDRQGRMCGVPCIDVTSTIEHAHDISTFILPRSRDTSHIVRLTLLFLLN